jgi:MscS family membrane protein
METLDRILNIACYGNTIREYLVSLIIIAATILAALLVNRYLRNKLLAWAQKTNTKLDDFFLHRIFPPIVYLIVVIGLAVAKGHLAIAPHIDMWLNKILFAVGLAVFFMLIIRLVRGAVEIATEAYLFKLEQVGVEDLAEQRKTAERIKKQVTEVLNMILVILAILTILSNLGVDLKAIWASLGIGGIAIVVAVKDPLSNLVGRMYIYSTGIFDEGHFIVFNGLGGTVKRISVFRTYLELFADMTTVSIPNADFVKGIVQNYYGRTKFMYKWDLDVPYDVPAQTIQDLIKRLRELVVSKPEVNPDYTWVYMERLDAYSKVVRVWFQAALPDWASSLFYGNGMLHEFQLLFEEMNLSFAFPTQTLELKTLNPEDGTTGTVPVALPEPNGKK